MYKNLFKPKPPRRPRARITIRHKNTYKPSLKKFLRSQ